MERYRFIFIYFFQNPFRELGYSSMCQMAGRMDVCQWIFTDNSSLIAWEITTSMRSVL